MCLPLLTWVACTKRGSAEQMLSTSVPLLANPSLILHLVPQNTLPYWAKPVRSNCYEIFLCWMNVTGTRAVDGIFEPSASSRITLANAMEEQSEKQRAALNLPGAVQMTRKAEN